MNSPSLRSRPVWQLAMLHAGLLWLAGPPVAFWPAACVALVPLLVIARGPVSLRSGWILWFGAFGYWLLALQGLRHAHPLMFLPLLALAGYLAIYPLIWVGLLRTLGGQWQHPAVVAGIWVGLEWIRNHLATGISVLMLGHSMADVPVAIQIADLSGTYAVSFVLVLINMAVADGLTRLGWVKSLRWATAALGMTLIYGQWRLSQPTEPPVAKILLLGRNEPTVYGQSVAREREIFHAYADQAAAAVQGSDRPIDAVVWPESMFAGGMAWMEVGEDVGVPEGLEGPGGGPASLIDFKAAITTAADQFQYRAAGLQHRMRPEPTPDGWTAPKLIAGVGVVRYEQTPLAHSGMVLVESNGEVADWYGKHHLVMFGEYIPLVGSIPGLRNLMPPGMGLATGKSAKAFDVGPTTVLPTICIESAVERVTIDQMWQLRHHEPGRVPTAVVTVTNDAWFRGTAVVDHHLRCAQMVAVGCRTPILSAANGGPTAWIDSCGRVVEKLSHDADGEIMATPRVDRRVALYETIGGLLPGLAAVLTLGWVLVLWVRGTPTHAPNPKTTPATCASTNGRKVEESTNSVSTATHS